jgi:hypothetical protein
MIRAQAHTYIARPRAAVFRFVAIDFFQNYRRWSPEVIQLQATSPGPVGLGSTGRQVRIDFGRRTEVNFRVTVFDELKRIDFRGISVPLLSSYRFAEAHRQTRLTFLFELARLDLPIWPISGLIHRQVQAGAERMVWNIKRLLESDSKMLTRRQ